MSITAKILSPSADQFTPQVIQEFETLSPHQQPAVPYGKLSSILNIIENDSEGIANRRIPNRYIRAVKGLRVSSSLPELFMRMVFERDSRLPTLIKGLKDPSILLKPFEKDGLSFYGLSVLSLSIMVNCDGIARQIIQRIQPNDPALNSQDKAGWTALHHAAATKSKELRKALKQKGASKEVKDNIGATPSTYKKMTTITKEDINYKVLFRIPGEHVDREILASELVTKYKTLFSEPPKKFLPYFKISRQAIYCLWKNNNEGWCPTTKGGNDHDVYSFNPDIIKYIVRYYSPEAVNERKDKPQVHKVALRKIERTDKGAVVKAKVGLGVFAVTDLKAGEFVGHYGGKIGFYDQSAYSIALSSTPLLDNCAKKNRSTASCIAHSFPNSAFVGDEHVETFVDVKKDEQICINYRGVFKDGDVVVELRPGALEEYGRTRTNDGSAKEKERNVYITETSTRSALYLILKGIHKKDSPKLEIDERLANFCFELVTKNRQDASLLADQLYLQNYEIEEFIPWAHSII